MPNDDNVSPFNGGDKARIMQSSDAVADPFNPAALRLSQDFVGMSGVKKELTTVPVKRPGKQTWFRAHPDDAYHLSPCAAIHLKEDGDYYIVAPALVSALADEVTYVVGAYHHLAAGRRHALADSTAAGGWEG